MSKQQAHRQINNLFLGFLTSKAIQLVGELGVADQLVDGPLHVDDIARRTSTRPDRLYRVLRLLAANGVFHEDGDRRFSLNAPGELLRSGVPQFF